MIHHVTKRNQSLCPNGSSGRAIDPVLDRVPPKAPYLNKYSGYERFFFEKCKEFYNKGIRSYFLHCPAGRKSTSWPLDFDAFPALEDAKDNNQLPENAQTTPDNFTYHAGRFMETYADTTLSVYLGALDFSPNMVVLAEHDTAAYLHRLAESIAPVTDICSQFNVIQDRVQHRTEALFDARHITH